MCTLRDIIQDYEMRGCDSLVEGITSTTCNTMEDDDKQAGIERTDLMCTAIHIYILICRPAYSRGRRHTQ